MDSILPASRTLSFVFVSPQEEPFLSLFKRLLSSAHTPTTSTIITLIPTVLSLYAFTIHHHYPRILHFTHSPQLPHATRSTDSSHHLVTHRIRSYFILSTYTTLPTLLVVDYVGALRGGFHFFWYSFADRTNLVFSHSSLAHCLIFHNFNLVMLQQSSSRTYNCSVSLPSSTRRSLKGFHHFLVPKSVSHLIIQVPELLQNLTVRTEISYQS